MFCGRTPSAKPIFSRLWLLGFAVWCATLWCQAEPVCAEEVAVEKANAASQVVETVTGEQIARWIAQLDHNRYAKRESAQFRLEKAGSAALTEVVQKAITGSLESSTRALNILFSWSEGSDPALRIAALEQIVALPHRPTESELAGEILADAREEAALARIIELGGLHTGDLRSRVPFINLRGRQLRPIQVIINSHWKGGVEGLDYLREIRRATTLSFHSAPLGDEVAPILLDLPQVKRIELYGTNFSDEAIEDLREKISSSNVVLDVRSGALLGIQGPITGQAMVKMVVSDSAAEKAGLQLGDLITEIDGEKVDDFTMLTNRIATHQPGDTVTLKVTRVDRKRKKTELDIPVTFDKWGADSTKPLAFTQPAAGQIHVVAPKRISFGRR